MFFEYGDGRGDQNPAYRRGKSAPVPNLENRWIYVTAVAQSASDIQLLVNGHDIGGAVGGSSDKPMASNFPGDVAKVGYMFTNSVVHRFEGMIDELRIWDRALSISEIRESMCRRLQSDEPGLIGYWNFDETDGDQLKDLSINGFHGTLKGNPRRVFSGAPVGNKSAYLYSGNWSGLSLSHEKLSAGNIAGNPYGIHIYSVNSIPSQTGGLDASDLEIPYYGVFLADDNANSTFDIAFTENNCTTFQRRDNSGPQWQETNTLAGIQHRLEITPAFEPGELGVDLGGDKFFCNESSFLLQSGANATGKTFKWNTGESSDAITVTISGVYAVEAKSECQTDRDTVLITFMTPPPPFSLGDDETLCRMEPRTLKPPIETSAFDLTWHDGSKEESLVARNFGTYWVKVENPCGVSADSIAFTKEVYSEIESYNFISPDNTDYKNQFFTIDSRLAGSRLAVFNRWGKPVYQSESYQNNWDGRGLPSGIYFYTVAGDCIEPLKGTLTIMR